MAATAEGQSYQYTRLAENTFRVLEVLSFELDISVKLLEYPSDSPPEYHTVSYAWGKEAPTETIMCDGKTMQVTPHLREGLRCICLASGQKVLWVDAICINQADEVEKAQQVSNMHHIYRNAKDVLVWLGQEQDNSDLAMAGMDEVKNQLPSSPEDVVESLFTIRSNERDRLFDIAMFQPLASLSRRAWFRRLWVSQEYIFSQAAFFICGTHILEGKHFVNILMKLSIHAFRGPEPEDLGDQDDLFKGFRALIGINYTRDSLRNKSEVKFFDVVMLGRERFTKEPVDHIYAALGMAEGPDAIYRENLPIDYSEDSRLSYWKLYAQFGKVALVHEPRLGLLHTTNSSDRPQGLPSWCPNLNSTSEVSAFSGVYTAGWPNKNHIETVEAGLSNGASSCKDSHPTFKTEDSSYAQVSSSSNTITIPGARLDEICKVGPECNWDLDFNTDNLLSAQPFAREFLAWLDSGEDICAEIHNDPGLALQVHEEVLVGANRRDGVGDSRSTKLKAYSVFKRLLRSILALKEDHAGREQNIPLYEMFDRFYIWILTLQEAWDNRVLFTTTQGRVGYSSKDIGSGDIVCMFYSGRTIYVLRPNSPTSATFRFVSDAYVYEYMNGEVFDLMHSGQTKEEIFAID